MLKNLFYLRARLHRLRKNPVSLKGTASQAAEKPLILPLGGLSQAAEKSRLA
jgi:hypothetical protein